MEGRSDNLLQGQDHYVTDYQNLPPTGIIAKVLAKFVLASLHLKKDGRSSLSLVPVYF